MKRSWKDVLTEIGLRLASLAAPAQPQQGSTMMANPNSPELKKQRQQVQQQIEALEQQLEDAPDGTDTSAQEQQLDQLHDQLRSLQRQQKDFRAQNRQQGGGRANAPGQQKKQ